MKQQWEKLRARIDGLSLRERVLIFVAVAFLLVALANMLLLDPLLAKQKSLADQVVQQQEKIKAINAQIEALLQARENNLNSPQRQRLAQIRQQLAEGDAYVQGRKDSLVPAENMANLLEQMLKKNGRLQLVKLQTLPVTPLVEQAEGKKPEEKNEQAPDHAAAKIPEAAGNQIFKHGVQITVRGSYADLLEYLVTLEHLPSQMFWGMVQMNVVRYPVAEVTLTVHTLSLDKTWLQV